MRVIKPDQLSLLMRTSRFASPKPHFAASIGAIAAVRLPGDRLLSEQRLWTIVEEQVGDGMLDEGFAKPRGEVVIFGSVFAPRGKRVPVVEAHVRIGTVDKRVVAVGDRSWRNGVASDPEPFESMPVDWQHAFGGPGFAPNPLGKGIAPAEGRHVLPNIEVPGKLIRSSTDQPAPIGLRPLDAAWPARASLLGTYDDTWLASNFPGFPRDLEPSFFNTAPLDQRIDGFFRGDEEILVTNMHSSNARLEASLPGIRARCLVEFDSDTGTLQELPLPLETIVLLPGARCAVLIFRARLVVREDDAADIRHLLLALEGAGDAKPRDEYLRAFAKRRARKRGSVVDDHDLLPSWFRVSELPPEELPELDRFSVRGGLVEQNLRRGLARRLATAPEGLGAVENALTEARARLEEAGIDPAAYPGLTPDLNRSGSLSAKKEPDQDEEEDFERASKAAEEARASAAQQIDEQTKKLKELCKEHGVQLEAARSEGGGPPEPMTERALDQLREFAALCRNAGIADGENLALAKLSDPNIETRLRKLDSMRLHLYREAVHYLPSAALLDPDASERLRRQLELEQAAGASFARRDLTGADLHGLDLRGADLREALLEMVDLRGADLTGANLERAILTRADLTGAKTRSIRLSGANLAEAQLASLDLSEVDLRGAVLLRADLSGASLARSNLHLADFAESRLSGADLGEARAAGALFGGAKLEAAGFRGADLSHALFQGLDVSGLDFSSAKLDAAAFVDCIGAGTVFQGASMVNCRFTHTKVRSLFERADFTGADLTDANLREARLNGATFERATLNDADLSEAECEGANFHRVTAKNSLWVRSNLKRARLTSANLTGATLKNAHLHGASFAGSNLFASNLMYVHVDGATDIRGAELGSAAYVEAPST